MKLGNSYRWIIPTKFSIVSEVWLTCRWMPILLFPDERLCLRPPTEGRRLYESGIKRVKPRSWMDRTPIQKWTWPNWWGLCYYIVAYLKQRGIPWISEVELFCAAPLTVKWIYFRMDNFLKLAWIRAECAYCGWKLVGNRHNITFRCKKRAFLLAFRGSIVIFACKFLHYGIIIKNIQT